MTMFYEEMKKRRESLGISLEQISNKTKINQKFLKMYQKFYSFFTDGFIQTFDDRKRVEIIHQIQQRPPISKCRPPPQSRSFMSSKAPLLLTASRLSCQ